MKFAPALLAVALGASVAAAQGVDVAAQIKLIETQPSGTDRSAWKEQRRDAARKLVQSKDKKAVPELIKLADTETFDIIGEIAIEGLGNFGDQSAVPVLQKVANDATRDKATRDLAKKALFKLGATATSSGAPKNGAAAGGSSVSGAAVGGSAGGASTSGASSGGASSGGASASGSSSGRSSSGGASTAGSSAGGAVGGASADGASASGSSVGGDTTGDVGAGGDGAAPGGDVGNAAGLLGGGAATSTELPALPALPDDTLAAYDRLTFAVGAASLSYDTARKRASFDGDVAAHYLRRVEREQFAFGYGGDAHVVAGYINPDGRERSRGAQVTASGNGEARFYRGKLYGVGMGTVGFQDDYISYEGADAGRDLKDNRLQADLQVALGVGYGRVLDVGGAVRVRRLARVLDAARALGKEIDAATAKKLQLTWWALRGERSAYRALVATVAILREAGILLGEPDAGLSYELLTVLRDTQLYQRPSGFDVQLAFGEGYLLRPTGDGDPYAAEEGRVEQLLASAGYGKQLADDKAELSATAFARLRLFAPMDQPAPFALGATGRLRRFAYGDHGDPLGALDVTANLLLSKDSCPSQNPDCGAQMASRIEGEVGFTLFMNQASGLRVAGQVAEDSGQLFIGGTLSATYGLLDGTFAGI